MAVNSGEVYAAHLFDGKRILRNMRVEWNAGVIQEIGEVSEIPGDGLFVPWLFPGLINLHAHLELSALRGQMPRGVEFPIWVDALQKRTAAWNDADWENSVRDGLRDMMASGITAVLDVGNSGVCGRVAEEFPLRVWASRECLGLMFAGDLPHLSVGSGDRVRYGYSVHAVYSCNQDLWRSVVRFCEQSHYPFTFHLAESSEEDLLLRVGRGPWRAWFDRRIPRHPFVGRGPGPLQRAQVMGLPQGSIAVHCNYLEKSDWVVLRDRRCGVVHCPQSARWFGHRRFDLNACKSAGVPLCLGTDSLASAESLNLWDQMALFAREYPEESLEDILARVTSLPAALLGLSGKIGCVSVGALADLVAADWNASLGISPHIRRVWIEGVSVYPD